MISSADWHFTLTVSLLFPLCELVSSGNKPSLKEKKQTLLLFEMALKKIKSGPKIGPLCIETLR